MRYKNINYIFLWHAMSEIWTNLAEIDLKKKQKKQKENY